MGIWNVAANCSCESFSARRITLTSGTRGARAHSSSVIGRASGSAMAAACRSASVLASPRLQAILRLPLLVLFMIAPSFPWFRQAGRDDPNPLPALCVNHGKEVLLDHAEQDIATLAVILTPVLTYHSEWVIEGQASCLEAYAVIGQILGGLDVIPLELIIFHLLRGTRIMQGYREEQRWRLSMSFSP